ncbi:uncharacterized protein LOC133286237 [Gastrolobium bilobum]|uniref:uncharacterized protein LOC133286237 n=1 Tax=Gastrolobium bilobum TaxID=150636 RepID=UPI002AAF12AB|nr:uncharacterized protein LOC133286237 [Gastrolobium bilobum]
MDQEDSKLDTENAPEMSFNPQSSGKDDSNKDTEPPEGSSKPELSEKNMDPEMSFNPQLSGKDDSNKDTEPPEGSSKPELSEKNMDPEDSKLGTENPSDMSFNPLSSGNDDSNKGTDRPEGSSKPELSEKKIDQEDKKLGTQNPPDVSGNDDSNKDTDPPEGSSKPELSDKNTPRSLKAKSKIVKKSLAGISKTKKNNGSQQIRRKKRNRKNKKVVDNGESCHNEDEKQISDNSQQKETNDEPPLEESHQAQKNKGKIIPLDKAERKQKKKEKHRESNKGSRSGTNKGKPSDVEKSQSKDERREKLGGFIFMCNAKTKPDCFRYRVMGVSAGKKDVVLGLKPGVKLFLYDFDLKLLYGIYKASSSGAMKLERRAFGGNFPAQVRFKISSDCFPLPESVFKKAIKENYNERNKFRTELTIGQVRKLTKLFRPVGIHSAVQPIHSPPKAMIREREAPEGIRGSWPHLHRERVTGTYAIPEPYEGDYEHHRLDPGYRGNVPAHIESLQTDPLYLDDSGHKNYFRGAISDHIKDPHYAYRYGASPRDTYLTPLSREHISSSSYLVGERPFVRNDNLPRREIVQDRVYSIYSAADPLSDYDRMQPYHGDKLEASHAPVSRRYSFAGPSFSRR